MVRTVKPNKASDDTLQVPQVPPDLPPEELQWTTEDDGLTDAVFAELGAKWRRDEERRRTRRERERKTQEETKSDEQ